MLNFLKGVLVGAANVIPGVSGGTVALLVGIYERLVGSISALLNRGEKKPDHLFFLITVLMGIVVGVVIFARILTLLLSNAPFFTYLFLIGLIVGSMPVIARAQKNMKVKADRIVLMAFGFVVVALTSFAGSGVRGEFNTEIAAELFGFLKVSSIEPAYALWLFLCGFVAIGAMIVPGFSGSALLVAMGEYASLLYFVDEMMITPLIFFILGAVPGIFIFARIIDHFLRTQPQRTYYLILGLVMGSVLELVREASTFTTTNLSLGIVLVATGVISAYGLGRLGK